MGKKEERKEMGEIMTLPAPCPRCKAKPLWGDDGHSLRCPVCEFTLSMKDKSKLVAAWNNLMKDRSKHVSTIHIARRDSSETAAAAARCREDARNEVAALNGRMLDSVADLDE